MSFVIAKKNSEFLETPVFHAGQKGEEEAVAVFTDREQAEQYIAAADWSDEFEVGELEPVQVLHWVVTANQQGTEMLVVDPRRDDQLDGEHQNVILLNDPLDAFAESLKTEIEKLGDRATRSQ